MIVVGRLGTEYRLRGLAGLARFLVSRIARQRSEVLFGIDLSRLAPADESAEALSVVVVDRNNVGGGAVASIEDQVLIDDNVPYREGLLRDDLLFAGLDETGKVVTYAFVLFQTRSKRLLGVGDELPLIANCFTRPELRGKRLYPRMLKRVCRELSDRGFRFAVISCEPQNQPSLRGIERAGFTGISYNRAVIVLSRIFLMRQERGYMAWRRSLAPDALPADRRETSSP